jgi:hypothetical protein
VCCAVNWSGIANATKTIVVVINVNFLDFMVASSVEAGGEPEGPFSRYLGMGRYEEYGWGAEVYTRNLASQAKTSSRSDLFAPNATSNHVKREVWMLGAVEGTHKPNFHLH